MVQNCVKLAKDGANLRKSRKIRCNICVKLKYVANLCKARLGGWLLTLGAAAFQPLVWGVTGTFSIITSKFSGTTGHGQNQ